MHKYLWVKQKLHLKVKFEMKIMFVNYVNRSESELKKSVAALKRCRLPKIIIVSLTIKATLIATILLQLIELIA